MQTIRVSVARLQTSDTVKLYMDGVLYGSVSASATDAGNGYVEMTIAANAWGADGERVFTATAQRGLSGTVVSSAVPRHVFVAADQSHWSAQSGVNVMWFDPNTLNTLADDASVTSFTASVGGMTLTSSSAKSAGFLTMQTDSTGNRVLYGNGSSWLGSVFSSWASSSWGAAPMQAFTDFTVGKYANLNTGGATALMQHTFYSVAPYGIFKTTLGPDAGSNLYFAPGSGSFGNAITLAAGQTTNVWSSINGSVGYDQMALGFDGDISATAGSPVTPGTTYGVTTSQMNTYAQVGVVLGGTIPGLIGDQVIVGQVLGVAYRQEISTYLAAKYQTSGVLATAGVAGASYDLSVSASTADPLDDVLDLRNSHGTGNERVTTAGNDYVATGSGNDTVTIKDLSFRYLDGGQGTDTWALDSAYGGSASLVLADYVSNSRGLSSGSGGLLGRNNNVAGWTNGGSGSVVANSTSAPDGTTTADTLNLTSTTTGYDRYIKFAGLSAGQSYTFSVWVKLGTATNLNITVSDGSGTVAAGTGTLGGDALHTTGLLLSSGASGSLSASEWARVDHTFVAPASGKVYLFLGDVPAAESALVQSAGSVFVWGAELNAGTSGPVMPSAQQLIDDARVNTAGYHKLNGFEVIDLAGSAAAQSLTVNTADVSQMSEDNKLWVKLGSTDSAAGTSADTLSTGNFGAPTWGYYTHTESDGTTAVYDRKWAGSDNGTAVELYARGGDFAVVTDATTGGTGSNRIATSGTDTLLATALADTFVWGQGTSGTDSVTGFSKAGGDRIDLRGILTGAGANSGNIGDFLQLTASGSDAVLRIDVEGNGVFSNATQEVVFSGVTAELGSGTAALQQLLTDRVIMA